MWENLTHRDILNFIGVADTFEDEESSTVAEWMAKGTIIGMVICQVRTARCQCARISILPLQVLTSTLPFGKMGGSEVIQLPHILLGRR